MSLVKLPKELILMVTDQLSLSSIESLALTLNQHITPVVLPRLKSLFAQRKHVKTMQAIFGGLYFGLEIGVGEIEQTREKFDIPSDAQLEEPSELQRLERLEYLDLKENLHWLRPLDEYTVAQMAAHNRHTVLDEKEIAELEKDAKSVNSTLPPSFLKFMGNSELVTRIPSTTANYFRISGGLRKVPKDIDGGAGGYSISIYSDQQ